MNDHDAMESINDVLDRFFRGELGQEDVLKKIYYISGLNSIEHAAAREAQK